MKKEQWQQLFKSEKGIETIEWIAFAAVAAVMIAGIMLVLTPGGSQVGQTVTSGVLCWASQIGGGGGGACTSGGGGAPTTGVGTQPGGGGTQPGGGQPGGGQPGGGNGGNKDGGGGLLDKLWNWAKGRVQDLTQFVLKDLPDALKDAAENTRLLITRITETFEVDLGDLGKWLASVTTTIVKELESAKTWQDVLDGFVKDLGRATAWTVALTAAVDVLDKLIRGQWRDIFTWDFAVHLLVDTAQGLLIGAAAVAITAAIVAAAPVELGAVAVAGITLGVAVVLGSIFDLSGVGDKVENWIKGLFSGGKKPEPAPAPGT